jgi:HD-GYP domain-containing protein (c-di-GMP phosphodiesterase class II)/CHASE2 domain-containing sensor protein
LEHGRRLYDLAVWVAVTALASLVIGTGIAQPVTRLTADALVRLAAERPPALPAGEPDVVLVAIDPQSLRARPDWPWPRSLHAEAVRRLRAAGAKAIAFDVDFSTERGDEADAELVRAVAEAGNVVLAAFRQVQVLRNGAVLEVANEPFPALAGAAAAVGSVHMRVDSDGVLRSSPLGIEIQGHLRSSLAEATLAVATGRAPEAGAGSFPVDYRRSAPAIPMLPMIDVIEGRFDPRDVAGRAVLIGASAAEFQDLWSTPVGPALPGVWIQAVTLRTVAALRAGEPALRHASGPEATATVALLLLVAAALGRGSDRTHGRRTAALVALAVVFTLGAAGLLLARGLLVDPIVPLGALAAQHVVGLERVRRRFGARMVLGEQSIATLARVGEVTAAPTSGDSGLGVALALLGDVVDASGVALLRASPERGLDGRRLDWQRRGAGEIGDRDAALEVLEARQVRVFDGARPGRSGAPGVAVYTPLHAGDVPIGVLVVERDRLEPLDATQLRTIATVGTQLALSAHNLVLLEDLRTTFDSSIEAIASAVEARDGYTEKHCRRLAAFSSLMAERVGLDAEEIEAIRLGALLHDVGKVGIRDEILLKPGRFTPTERGEMEGHANIGHRIISGIHGLRPTTLACVRHHHERWDGTGYPDRLRGEETPLGARIVAVVDVWDALSTARPYKPALPQEQVRGLLRKDGGSHFDAALVDLFLALLDEEGEELLAWIDRAAESER